jgi:hypothetical protein
VLGPALGEADDANAAAPGSEPGIAGEELVEFGVSDAAEALEIGLVERLTGACRIMCQLGVPPRGGEQFRRSDHDPKPLGSRNRQHCTGVLVTAYPWALAGLFSLASVAFNIAHAPDRPVAQLVFAMAPVALVLTTHLLMQQVSWRRPTPDRTLAPVPELQAGPEPALPHRPNARPAPELGDADRGAHVAARGRVRAAYEAQVAAGQTPTGAGLVRAAGVSERYGQRLLAEFTADPTLISQLNGDRRTKDPQ